MALNIDGTTGIVYDNLASDVRNLFLPKNWIINGMFDVWQRGTTQTVFSGYGSDDKWFNGNTSSTKTITRESFIIGQTDVPNNPQYFCRTVVVSGPDSVTYKQQRIEDVTKLAGKIVTVSFWAKADANKNLSIEFAQNFGSGGSGTVHSIGVQKFALTTIWQKFTKTVTLPSVVGKTIGVSSFLQLTIWFDANSSSNARTDSLGNQSGTFDIANVSLVEGSVAVECQNQPYADVLIECQRYLFPVVPLGGSSYYKIGTGFAIDTTNCIIIYYLPVPMRTSPTVTWNDVTKFWVSDGASNLTLTSITYENPSPNIIKFGVTKTAGLVQFRPYLFERAGNTDGYIWASAEL